MAKENILERLGNKSDVLIGVGVITILIVMLIPMPTFFIDFLLTLNFLLAFIVVLVPVYIGSPSEFTVFPGLLLVITLFRLSLNVATTRLILGEARAGKVIEVFGSFTIRGNTVVGIIIFLVLVIINFMVITKGSGRVAEVAARFTLDAMPGKQMAIDADLNNGVITESEAEERRDAIRREADFYGAMDGASKFVKGDATAGLIITFLNIIGGIIIGMLQMGFTFTEALQKYTILTVGDGLVTQIPALLISSAAGIIVTRSGTRASLGKEVTSQLLQEPKVLYIAGTVIMLFAFAPGMPWYFFTMLSLFTIGLGYLIQTAKKRDLEEEETAEDFSSEPADDTPENFTEYLQVDPLELEIGYSLITYVNEEEEGDLLDRISSLRKQIAMEIGIVVPPIRIRDNIALVPNQYIIKIRGEEVASSECLLNHYLALDSGSVEKPVKGIKTKEPAFDMPAVWITEDKREKAEMHGYTVIEPPAMIATHIAEVIKSNAENIITRQDVQDILDNIKKTNEAVVNELVPNLLSVGNVEQVLKNLLHERVPIRDMVTILETLADYAPITRDVNVLTEYVRLALSRTISKEFVAHDGVVYGITFSPQLEAKISEVVNAHKQGNTQSALSPDIVSQLYDDIKEATEAMNKAGLQPLVLTSPLIRSYAKHLIEPVQTGLPVLSYNEIPTHIPIHSQITLEI